MKLVFVSSTFKDMQYERDMLQTFAIPVLDNALRQYGEKAYFGDLRWGVNTTDLDSDEGSRKVLQVCLDQIDNCKPYMIVLVGERYGWIPAQELIDEACVLKGIEKIKDISVTELEIDYGALLDPDFEGRVLFYFRNLDKTGMTEQQCRDYEAESPVHLQKVEDLKRRIRETYPDHIRYYDAVWNPDTQKVEGLEDFLSQVEKDLAEVLLRDLEAENNIPWQERSMRSAHRYFEEKGKTLADIRNAYEDYRGSLPEGKVQVCYFTGEDGSGKSTMLMDFYCRDDGPKVAFSYGLDKFSRDSQDIARILLYKLEDMMGLPHETYETVSELVEGILDLAEDCNQTLSVYVDNAGSDFLTFLSFLEWSLYERQGEPFNLYIMVAMEENLPFYPLFDRSVKYTMSQLEEQEARKVLDAIVRSNHKELSQAVKDRILSKDSSSRADYLNCIVKRLMILDSQDFAAIRAMGDGMDNINAYMLSIVDSTADDRYGIITELIDEAKDRINREFVERLMCIFTHIGLGLTQAEIKSIFAAYKWEFADLDFSLTVRLLEDVLHFDPEDKWYKIKNKAVHAYLRQFQKPWDPMPAVEYMLSEKALRPYAFQAAVMDAEVADLVSVLKRSGITDIRKSIRILVTWNLTEKAEDLLIALAREDLLLNIQALPAPDTYDMGADSMERHKRFTFLTNLALRCNDMVNEGEAALFELAARAWLMAAEHYIETDIDTTLELLVEVWDMMARYPLAIDPDLPNALFMTMLRAVSSTRSKALFDKIIGGEAYLDRFLPTGDQRRDALIRMEAYWLYSQATMVFDPAAHEAYLEKSAQLHLETEDLAAYCSEADFDIIAQQGGQKEDLLGGKVIYPLSQKLLRAEIIMGRDDETEDQAYDTVIKAREFYHQTHWTTDGVWYLKFINSYLQKADEPEEEFYEELVDDFVDSMADMLQHGLRRPDYAELLMFAQVLDAFGDTGRLPEILKRCHWDDPFAKIVRGFIRHHYIKPDKLKLLGVLRSYKQQREQWLDTDYVAVGVMDYYFEEAGCKV